MLTLSNRFLLVAIAAGAVGMCLGLGMGVTQDFRLAPAHAHLNLLGWVSMFLYGLFYRCAPEAVRGGLPRAQFWLATFGLVLMIPALALVLLGRHAELFIGLGALLTLLSLLVFAAVAVRNMQPPRSLSTPGRGTAVGEGSCQRLGAMEILADMWSKGTGGVA